MKRKSFDPTESCLLWYYCMLHMKQYTLCSCSTKITIEPWKSRTMIAQNVMILLGASQIHLSTNRQFPHKTNTVQLFERSNTVTRSRRRKKEGYIVIPIWIMQYTFTIKRLPKCLVVGSGDTPSMKKLWCKKGTWR